jgi:hypothetical protein
LKNRRLPLPFTINNQKSQINNFVSPRKESDPLRLRPQTPADAGLHASAEQHDCAPFFCGLFFFDLFFSDLLFSDLLFFDLFFFAQGLDPKLFRSYGVAAVTGNT